MLYQFLIKSHTTTFQGQVLLYKDSYMINNSYNRTTLLKQILGLTYIDTRAKAFYISNSLIDMKQQMTKTAGNIVEFNDWVYNQVGQLHTRLRIHRLYQVSSQQI